MTIDERLEALAQSVELLTHDMHGIQDVLKENENSQRQRDTRIDQLHTDMMLAIARLANTAHAHNGQLADHEERIDKLEDR